MRTSRTLRSLLVPATTLTLLALSTDLARAQGAAAKTAPVVSRGNHTGASDASAGRGASDASGARSADMFVKVEPIKGKERVIRCPDGYCVTSNLAPGRYMVSLSDSTGRDVSGEATLTYTVLTAREAGSGMATGKRQHGPPMRITKEWNRTLPGNMIDVAEPGSTIDMQLKATINTTRSNIKR